MTWKHQINSFIKIFKQIQNEMLIIPKSVEKHTLLSEDVTK